MELFKGSPQPIVRSVSFYSGITFYVKMGILTYYFFVKNAFVWSSFHWKIDFLFSKGRSGLPKEAKFGTNLIYWFIDPKNDPNSFKLFGIGKSFIAFVLSNEGAIPVFEILNPSHLISF